MNFQQDFITGIHDFNQNLVEALPRITRGILFIIIGLIAIRILMRLLTRGIDFIRMSLGLKEIVLILARAGMYVLLAIGVLQVFGLTNIAFALSGFIAAVSIGISQGFTQTVSDLVAGIQLANDQDFRVGDKVVAGHKDLRITGYIVEMDTKKSRILDGKGDLHIIPNSVIDTNPWTLLERDEITIAHLSRGDIIKVIHHKIKKGAKK